MRPPYNRCCWHCGSALLRSPQQFLVVIDRIVVELHQSRQSPLCKTIGWVCRYDNESASRHHTINPLLLLLLQSSIRKHRLFCFAARLGVAAVLLVVLITTVQFVRSNTARICFAVAKKTTACYMTTTPGAIELLKLFCACSIHNIILLSLFSTMFLIFTFE